MSKLASMERAGNVATQEAATPTGPSARKAEGSVVRAVKPAKTALISLPIQCVSRLPAMRRLVPPPNRVVEAVNVQRTISAAVSAIRLREDAVSRSFDPQFVHPDHPAHELKKGVEKDLIARLLYDCLPSPRGLPRGEGQGEGRSLER